MTHAQCQVETREHLCISEMYRFEVQSCIRGYHVYQNVWTLSVGQVLGCEREPQNREDPNAVATKASGIVVGYIPCSVSCIFSTFLSHSKSISCTITGSRRYSSDLS